MASRKRTSSIDSPVGGTTKRVLTEIQNLSKNIATTASELDEEASLQAEITRIENGTSTEILRQSQAFARRKELMIQSADALRKMQIRNINELFEWEKVDAHARYTSVFFHNYEFLHVSLRFCYL
jgi:hypothetical protein